VIIASLARQAKAKIELILSGETRDPREFSQADHSLPLWRRIPNSEAFRGAAEPSPPQKSYELFK